MAISHQFLTKDQVTTTHIESGHINIHLHGLHHSPLQCVALQEHHPQIWHYATKFVVDLCLHTTHGLYSQLICSTSEFLSFDDVYENVMVMGHYSSTCCYYFENECQCHFCSNHFLVLSMFFLGFWLLTLLFDYRSSLSFMKVDVNREHVNVSEYL
jgi:hypothetical protein